MTWSIRRTGEGRTLGICDGGPKRLHYLVQDRFELRDGERLLQERQRAGMLPHGLIVFRAAPLGIHGHLCAVDAAMERRRNEARRAVDRAIGCASEKIDKSLLVDRLDREDIYQRDDAFFLERSIHETPPHAH